MFGDYFDRRPDGYRQSIQMGMQAASRFSGRMVMADSAGEEQIAQLREVLDEAERIVIGAGAGLSTSAGFVYDGERFRNYFFDFEEKYGFHDMYSGGFYVMQLEPEITWAYWARNIYINRYKNAPRPVYRQLLELVEDTVWMEVRQHSRRRDRRRRTPWHPLLR